MEDDDDDRGFRTTARTMLLKMKIGFHLQSVETVLQALDAPVDDILKRAEQQAAKGHEGYAEILGEEVAELNTTLTRLSELLVAGSYHFAERTLKWLLRIVWSDSKDYRSLPSIVKAYEDHGIDLHKIDHWAEIDLMRVFANNMKHQEGISQNLLNHLGLETHETKESHILDDELVEKAILDRLGLEDPGRFSRAIATQWADRVTGFLEDVDAVIRKNSGT